MVVVDAEEVERVDAAAEFGEKPARKHVPRLPLVLGDLVGAPGELGRVAWRRDVNQRLDVENACRRVFGADRLDRAQRAAHEPPFRFPADVAMRAAVAVARVDLALVRMDDLRLRDRPGEEADLVDRRVDGDLARSAAQRARRRGGEVGESIGEVVGEEIDVVRASVVHQRPEQLQPVPVGDFGEAQRAAEVEAARRRAARDSVRLGDSPADALAHRAQAERGETAIVVVEMLEMAVRANEIERDAVGVAMVRAFEPRHPERAIGMQRVGGWLRGRREHGRAIDLCGPLR